MNRLWNVTHQTQPQGSSHLRGSISKILIFTGLLFALGNGSCKSSDNKSSAPNENPPQSTTLPSLNASMQGLKLSLEKLLPSLVDTRTFSEPTRQEQIKTEISTLKEIASKVSHSPMKEKLDPSFAFLSQGFQEEINRAYEAYGAGKTEYARYSLMNVTSYCIECHTRTASGPVFSNENLDSQLSKLRPLERGEFLLATRQFDQALAEFLKVLEAKTEKFQFLEFDRALRYSLAITVKFRNDPVKTETVIKKLSSSPQIPYYLKQAALIWSQAVTEWKDDLKKSKSKKSNLGEQLSRAEALIKRGRQAQVGISDRSGDVYLLRALSALHQILVAQMDKNQLGKALFLTGQAYESVRDLALWSLHENYFETCVRRVPHTNWAMNCYKSLEESLVIGFTGSSGTKLPYDVQVRLTELENLAKPEIPQTK